MVIILILIIIKLIIIIIIINNTLITSIIITYFKNQQTFTARACDERSSDVSSFDTFDDQNCINTTGRCQHYFRGYVNSFGLVLLRRYRTTHLHDR